MSSTNIDIPRVLLQRSNVNVGAVYGAIWGPFNVLTYDSLAIEIQNPDVSQTLDCFVDIATALAGPFSTSVWQGLAAIQPSETRSDSFRKPGQSIIRLIAKASGAGIANVVLTVAGVEHRVISGQL